MQYHFNFYQMLAYHVILQAIDDAKLPDLIKKYDSKTKKYHIVKNLDKFDAIEWLVNPKSTFSIYLSFFKNIDENNFKDHVKKMLHL